MALSETLDDWDSRGDLRAAPVNPKSRDILTNGKGIS